MLEERNRWEKVRANLDSDRMDGISEDMMFGRRSALMLSRNKDDEAFL